MDMRERKKVKIIRGIRSQMHLRERHKKDVVLQSPCVVMSVILA